MCVCNLLRTHRSGAIKSFTASRTRTVARVSSDKQTRYRCEHLCVFHVCVCCMHTPVCVMGQTDEIQITNTVHTVNSSYMDHTDLRSPATHRQGHECLVRVAPCACVGISLTSPARDRNTSPACLCVSVCVCVCHRCCLTISS